MPDKPLTIEKIRNAPIATPHLPFSTFLACSLKSDVFILISPLLKNSRHAIYRFNHTKDEYNLPLPQLTVSKTFSHTANAKEPHSTGEMGPKGDDDLYIKGVKPLYKHFGILLLALSLAEV